MQRYVGKMCYEHENYMEDCNREKAYKQEICEKTKTLKLSFFKKNIIMKLVKKLCDLEFLLDEETQKAMVLNKEIWSCDCLEYDIDAICDFVKRNAIQPVQVSVEQAYEYCNVENDMNISIVKMNDTLRESKERNPIIILMSQMFTKPFIVNGNHRIRDAFDKKVESLEIFVIDANEVIDCLATQGYKDAYKIYVKMHKLIGLKLNC